MQFAATNSTESSWKMIPTTKMLALICGLVFLVGSAEGNLSNLEGINEVKFTMSWVQYLRNHQVKDEQGHLLASKYLVDENGVAFSGELSYPNEDGDHDERMKNFLKIRELVGCGPENALIDASRLRLDPDENPNQKRAQRYAKVWSRYAKDMFVAIEAKQINDLAGAKDFLKQFTKHVFRPWQEVIHARQNSILRADRQDAIHLAILKAHSDSFALVRERMFEKLVAFWPDIERHLPKVLDWNEVHGRIHLDHIRHEFRALAKYRQLRQSLLNELNPSELQLIIEVLPIAVDNGFYASYYSAYEVGPRMVHLCQDGDKREIDHKYLVKLEDGDRVADEQGRELNAEEQAPELRRFLWRRIHEAVESVCLHVINSIDSNKLKPIDHTNLERIYTILVELKEAVLQRANALNGMIDEEIAQDSLTDFHAQRNNLNGIFSRLRTELPSEKVEIYETLMKRLGLVPERDIDQNVNRSQLRVDRESLKNNAKQAFSLALDRLHGISLGLDSSAKTLRRVFEDVADCYEADGPRDQFRRAFDEVKSELSQYSKFLDSNLDNSKSNEPEGDSHSAKTPGVVLAEYQRFNPIAAEELAAKVNGKVESAQSKLVQGELNSLKTKLDKEIRKVIEDLNEFRTNTVAHAIRTGDERLPHLIRDVFRFANETFNQIDGGKSFNLGSMATLEAQLERVISTMEQRGRSLSLRPSCHRYSVSREPAL